MTILSQFGQVAKNGFKIKTYVNACPMPKAGTGSACFLGMPHSWDVTLHKIQP
jgi:hypothetical protein